MKLRASWLPACFVLVTVLAAGSRLIVLSVQQSVEQARSAAQTAAERSARAIESQLAGLARRATEASRAGPDVFEWAANGSIRTAGVSDRALAKAIVGEWQAAVTGRGGPAHALLGPMREGSEWLIAARAPRERTVPQDSASQGGWVVAYADLDRLLAGAQVAHAIGAGNDFALVRTGIDSGYAPVYAASSAAPLSRPAVSTIRAPRGFVFATPGALTFEIRPRDGWYPTHTLAEDIGLLALIAWLLTFITHDLTLRTHRLRTALAAARYRLHAANQRLSQEVEQRERLQESVDRARYHDAFTGLPNRYYFMDQLDRVLRGLRGRHSRRIAVFLIAIERFQLINETLGHTAGDELMLQAARRFQRAVPSWNVLARWDGDQFALLVPDLESVAAAAQLATDLQLALREPFEMRRHRLAIAARMGLSWVATWPQRAEQVMREADVALSVAKRQEEVACVAYSPALGGDAASLVSLEADLHVALERRELQLLFQPIVALQGRRVVGAEALLRWLHPVEGLLRPDRFLRIAEDAGLILPITRWTIRRVCMLASEWRQQLPAGMDFYLSVNLSASVLGDTELSDYVAALLRETAIPPQALKFELTEGGLISNVAGARETLERLRRTGVELMLDDFGTGYSSLNYLRLFPFDYVKIDRPAVGDRSPQQSGASLASAMVQLASSLGLTPIAEVVESQATADALEEMGCHFGQGNFFCAPVEADAALACMCGDTRALAPPVPAPRGQDDSPTLILPALESPEDTPVSG